MTSTGPDSPSEPRTERIARPTDRDDATEQLDLADGADGTGRDGATEQIDVGATEQIDPVDATEQIGAVDDADRVDDTRAFETPATRAFEAAPASAAPTPTAPTPAAPTPRYGDTGAGSGSGDPAGPTDTAHAPAAPSPSTPPAPPSPPATTSAPAPVPVPEDRGPRSGTVVWGLIVAVVGVGILAVAAGARIDVQLALIVLLAAAGVALLVGSVLTAARRKNREQRAGR
jgi:hypothetical protein